MKEVNINDLIYWLNIILGMTVMMWLPYIINMILKQGLFNAMGYREDLPQMSPWAQRAKKAHYNAIENLVVFAPAVICYLLLKGSDLMAIQCSIGIYFFARIIHYVSYTLAIPYVRTVSFAAGWGATLHIIYKVCEAAA